MREPYPAIEPYDHGMLPVGDQNEVYWETCGNPSGKPALMVHGGPGTGCSPGQRRSFDPKRYRVVLFDQRGCGRSRPHASDPATDLSVNTTEHLIDDIERLRDHLGIDRWVIFGASWGAALALAYAERFPARVSALVLAAITTARRREAEWLYRGVGRIFPEAWRRFATVLPEGERDDLPAGYNRLLNHADPAVRERARIEWARWEDTVLSLEETGNPEPFTDRSTAGLRAVVRICAHCVAHDAWLRDNQLLEEAWRLAGIPGVLIHGRRDLSCPVETGMGTGAGLAGCAAENFRGRRTQTDTIDDRRPGRSPRPVRGYMRGRPRVPSRVDARARGYPFGTAIGAMAILDPTGSTGQRPFG